MIVAHHRVNTIEGLKSVPAHRGVEVDVRGEDGRLLLSHDPIDPSRSYDELEPYLKEVARKGLPLVIFNMKEAGHEQRVIDLAARLGIGKDRYFFLDVEFPYIFSATRTKGVREIAVRYSEAEPIEAVEAQTAAGKTLLDWVWIDTNTRLPLDAGVVERLRPWKTCLVSPDRWGRPQDIAPYAKEIKRLGMRLDAVMSGAEHADEWEKAFSA